MWFPCFFEPSCPKGLLYVLGIISTTCFCPVTSLCGEFFCPCCVHFCLVWFATPQETSTKPDSKKPVGTGTLLSCDTWLRPRHTYPKTRANPAGYTPDKKAADPDPYLPESVQGRPLPHPASWYTLHLTTPHTVRIPRYVSPRPGPSPTMH
jgi:hypothetical protein